MHTNFFHSLWQLECPGRDSNPPPCGSWQTMQLLPGSTGAGSTSRGSSCSHSWDCCSFWNTKHFQMKLSSHDEVCEVDASTQKSVKFKSSESVWWFENSQNSFQNTKPLLFKYIYIFFSWKFSLIRDCTTSNCDLTHQWPFPLLHFGVELLKNLSQNRTNRKYNCNFLAFKLTLYFSKVNQGISLIHWGWRYLQDPGTSHEFLCQSSSFIWEI